MIVTKVNEPERKQSSLAALVGERLKGTVTYTNEEKGYGFVRLSGGAGELFIHAKFCAGYKLPAKGASVNVTVMNGRDAGRYQGTDVEVVEV